MVTRSPPNRGVGSSRPAHAPANCRPEVTAAAGRGLSPSWHTLVESPLVATGRAPFLPRATLSFACRTDPYPYGRNLISQEAALAEEGPVSLSEDILCLNLIFGERGYDVRPKLYLF